MLGTAVRGFLRVAPVRCWRPVTPRSPFSSSRPLLCSAGQGGSQDQPLRHWALSVSPFTCLQAQLSSCSISVSSLDPHAFPAADRAFITLRGVNEGQEPAQDLCRVHYDEGSRVLRITEGEGSGELSIHLQAPIKSNLFITTEGTGHVHISKMECDICKVSTQQGDCTLHSVKSHQVEVRSSGGNVTGLGTIHGNVDILTTGQSAVDLKKLQGTTMKVSTERGSVKVRAVYAESSSVSSRSGRVELGHVHGSAEVKNESGDIVIDGSNDSLKVSSHSGHVDVYVGDGGSANIATETGAVSVRVPSSVTAAVELSGASVHISPDVVFHETEKLQAPGQTTVLGFVNGDSSTEQPHIKAQTTTGSVTLKTQSWFESLKLRG